jgi:hypothetical protein
MSKIKFASWLRVQNPLLPRVLLSLAGLSLVAIGAWLSAAFVPYWAMTDYLGAVIMRFSPRASPVTVYSAFAGLVALPILGRFLHELDGRKKDGSLKPLRTSVLFALVTTFGLDVVIRIAYHISYRTMSPTPAPLDFVAAPLLVTLLYGILRASFWTGGETHLDQIRRGIRVIFSPREAALAFARESRKRGATGVNLHPSLTLPLDQERQHVLLFGAPGSGKTQVMVPLLQNIRERGDPVVLYDFKGDYTGLLGEDEGTLILSPFDARGARWDIAVDIDTELKATEFAASLIPDGASKEPFFRKAAQDILTGVLCRLQAEHPRAWTIQDLVAILLVKDQIVESCRLYRPAALNTLGSLEGRQAAGIIGELRAGTIQLEYLAKAWSETSAKLSLSEWAEGGALQKRYPMVIIRGHQQYEKLDGFLTAQLFSLLTKKVLSLPDSRERRIWAFLDEFGNLPRIEGLERLLTAVRSKGLRVVAAIQDIAQIEVTYSPAFTRTFFNCFGTVLAGLNSGATAKWLSENFGRNQIERDVYGESTSKRGGAGGHGRTRSTQHQVVIENALLDTDFSNLTAPTLKSPALFWTRIGGWPIGKLAFLVVPLEQPYNSEIAPAWISEVPKIVHEGVSGERSAAQASAQPAVATGVQSGERPKKHPAALTKSDLSLDRET